MLHRRDRSVFVLAALTLATASCQDLPGSDTEGLSQAATEMYEIDFNARPAYLEKNVIVLTFDDGPDSTYTAQVLNILKDKDVKASFFINTDNNAKVDTQPAAQALVRRIVSEGHELATHTAQHIDLAVQTEARIEQEIVRVEETVTRLFGENGPKMTLLRAPFGRPYQSAHGSEAYRKVSAVVSRHAVHIGWAIDSNDWMYSGDANRVYDQVIGLIKTPGQGAYGVILMHSINPQTVGALPRIIDYMKANGFVFKLTEDVVRARFGMSSAQLLGKAPVGPPPDAGAGGSGGSGGSADAGAAPDARASTADAAAARLDSGATGAGGQGGGGSGTGGKAGTGGTGTGGQGGGKAGTGGTEDPQNPPPSRSAAPDGGCSYGAAAPSAPAALTLLALALLRRRRRR